MKIVVTGALGHIGSYLTRRLPIFFPECEVVMIDNLATQRYASLFDLPDKCKYKFVEDDVTKMELEPVFEGAVAVIQLAAITDATSSFDNADEVERVNFTATERVANACIRTGAPMIMASSTSVYGTHKNQVDEDCSPEELKPQSPYAETKLKEEALTRAKCKEGLNGIIFRYGTIFGVSPGMRFHTAVNKFCWQSVMGTPLTVWKTAYDQKRPYLYLDDCVRAIAFVIEKELWDGRVYNVVSENCTVRNVVDAIKLQIPTIGVSFVDHKIMNQLSYEVLNTRMEKLGFRSQNSLRKGIRETIKILENANTSY